MTYLEPALPLFLLLGLIGLLRAWRRSSKGGKPWLLTISLSGLVLLSMVPSAWLFSRPLEMWYAKNPMPGGMADAIVVLVGPVEKPVPERPYAVADKDSYPRLRHAAWLFKNWAARPNC